MRRSGPAAALLLLLAAGGLQAQEPAPGILSARRLMLAVMQEKGTGFTPVEMTLISRSLLLALQDARSDLVLLEPVRQPASGSDEEIAAVLGDSGGDCWMLVELSGNRSNVVVRVRSWDMEEKKLVLEKTVPRQGGDFQAASLVAERWDDVAGFLAGTYPPRGQASKLVPRETGSITLTVQAQPGTAISLTGPGRAKALVAEDGSARIDLPSGGIYELQARRRGTSPISRRLVIRGDRSLALEQLPASRFSIDASLQLAWPGLAFSWTPVPDTFFLRAGLTTYVLGLVLSGDLVLSSDPLTNLDILAAVYLAPAGSPWRAYVGLGGFLRVVHAPGAFFGIDPLAPAGIEAVLGIEAPLAGRALAFAEYQPMLYATPYSLLFSSAVADSPGWLFLPNAALQTLNARFGVRWKL